MRVKTALPALLFALSFFCVHAQTADTMIVHFDLNQSLLRPDDRVALDDRFRHSKSLITSIELAGFCDSVGENLYNDSLAWRRVAEVKQYLESKGVADSLFKVLYSFGKRKPLNDNGDEEKRSRNRRVTVIWHLAAHPASGSALRAALQDTAAVIGKSIVLPDLLFYRDLRYPLPGSFPTLRELLAIMKEHPGLRLEIDGFVCCMPDGMDGLDFETKKQDLSVQRAKYVYDYLARYGIDTTRMSYRGFGAHGKIFPHEENSELMMRNRRVEIKILSWTSLIKE